MEIRLYRGDLLPRYEGINASCTRFRHFKPEVREVIRASGRAVFWSNGNHNAIHPPTPRKTPFIMNPKHPLWNDFCNRLAGPAACNFRLHPVKRATWECSCKSDRPFATRLLKKMGANVTKSLEFLALKGGHCDCTILFNVDP